MGYKPKHSLTKWRTRLGVAVGALTLVGGGVALATGTASAATTPICSSHCEWQQLGSPSGYDLNVKGEAAQQGTPIIAWKGEAGNPSFDFTVKQLSGTPATSSALPVTFSHSSDGATAGWANGNIVLSPGSTASSTYAEMDVTSPPSAVPTVEPFFTTDNYAAGSPRWVIELTNGHSLWGYPAKSGLNGTDMAWTADNGNTYSGYQAAYTAAGAASTTVKDAFIVADGDQVSGTTDTLTGVQYNGQDPSQPVAATPGGYEIVYTPYTNFAGASAAANSSNSATKWAGTEATNAYSDSANGNNPLYCVAVGSAVSDAATLEPCSSNNTNGTVFTGAAGLDSHTLFEPASDTNLALNDKGYGGDGSPIIAWAANSSSWNEEFWPGTVNAAS